jgi:hypothetical protein
MAEGHGMTVADVIARRFATRVLRVFLGRPAR